VEMPNFCQTN